VNKLRVLVPIVYMLGIFLISSIPGVDDGTSSGMVFQIIKPQWQNFLHVPLYLGLTVAWVWALRGRTVSTRQLYLRASIITSIYGVFDECYQLWVPGRFGSVSDALLNFLGVLLAVLILYWYAYRAKSLGADTIL
jgi:VanZ family protein